MLDQTTRFEAEAHTTLCVMLRIIQAITSNVVEDELALLEEQRHLLFQGFTDNHGFVLGYSEVIQASLISLMEPLIDQPEAFGYKADEDLKRWFFLREGGAQAIPVVTESSDQELANMLATINGLAAGCRRAGNRWEKLTEVMQDTNKFVQTILASLPEYQVECKRTDSNSTISVSNIIKQRVAAWLAGPLCEGSAISSAVEFINPGGTRYFAEECWEEEIMPDVLTPMDEDYGMYIPMLRQGHSSYPLGVLVAVAVAITDLLGSRISNTFPYSLKRDSKMLDQCVKAKLDRCLKSYKNAENQVLVPGKIARIPTPAVATPLESVYCQHKRLKAILGKNRRLVASADELSPALIEPVLNGLSSRLALNGHVNVLWIRSMRDDTPYTKITIALEMPLTGIVSDHSTWWCFYGVAGTGTFIPDIIKSEVAMGRLLNKYRQHVKIKDIGPLDDDQLIKLLSPHGWNKLRAAHKRNVEANAALRAALSETVTALYISSRGYITVLNNVKLRNPNREIDAAGGRHLDGENQILVAEVKGRSTHNQELQRSYERFCELVAKLQEKPGELADQLGLQGSPTTVKGIYISLGNAEKFEIPEHNDVQLWGFDKFCKELRRARIPMRYEELLKKELIAQLGPTFGDDDWIMIHQDAASEDATEGIKKDGATCITRR